ncbi:uncharacterized protein FTJAE_4541 [Fusarium tjaetaba]|uniref:Uncharacterized protein n=1 Tax=Fusarium tjaetaba TaxID=1567544 RepID=A0A8H5VZB9_9HYPO|nr:uncharacterized protein FTJAE_4541 [Fusarium tjaetaba]KAF5639995.1 hypothetical protein FTJAE_4541 [Fusarium tjaetaba]
MVAFLKSRAEARDKERRALVAQETGLTTLLCQKWQHKADKLEAKEAGSSIEERFEEALRKKKETKAKETDGDADAEEERVEFWVHFPYVSVSAVPRLAANTQFAQRTSKPTGSFKTKFNSRAANTSTTMPTKRSAAQFSDKPLALGGLRGHPFHKFNYFDDRGRDREPKAAKRCG